MAVAVSVAAFENRLAEVTHLTALSGGTVNEDTRRETVERFRPHVFVALMRSESHDGGSAPLGVPLLNQELPDRGVFSQSDRPVIAAVGFRVFPQEL